MNSSKLAGHILCFSRAAFPAIIVLLGAVQSASSQTLLLRYAFDESGSGSADATDAGTAPAALGVFVGATRIANTPGGHSLGAVDFSDAAAPDNLKYVDGGDANKLDGLETFTLTAWINVQAVPAGNRRILAKQAPTSFDGFSWNVNDPAEGARAADNFGLRLFIGGSKGFQHDLSDPNRVTIDADNKWVFIAVTYDGTLESENVKYYAGDVTNAVTNQVTTSINSGTTTDSDARFTVSHTDAAITANTALQGWMDDVRVYSGVLNTDQLDTVRRENLPAANPPRAVTLFNLNRATDAFTFDFQAQAGRSHRIEYKNALSDPVWLIQETVTANGALVTVTNNTTASPARFYQVVTQ